MTLCSYVKFVVIKINLVTNLDPHEGFFPFRFQPVGSTLVHLKYFCVQFFISTCWCQCCSVVRQSVDPRGGSCF